MSDAPAQPGPLKQVLMAVGGFVFLFVFYAVISAESCDADGGAPSADEARHREAYEDALRRSKRAPAKPLKRPPPPPPTRPASPATSPAAVTPPAP